MGEGHDLRFEVGGKRHRRHLESPAPQRLLGCSKEIPERRDLLEEIAEPSPSHQGFSGSRLGVLRGDGDEAARRWESFCQPPTIRPHS